MKETTHQPVDGLHSNRPVYFPRADGSRIPFSVYTSPEIYQLEQERIFRGPTWSFVALEAELPDPNDFKSTFVGDTPVVVIRNEDRSLSVWVNRCAHRGAMVCRAARGNAKTHICVYHQWSYDTRGSLRGVPLRNGVKGAPGMPADFDPKEHGLQRLRTDSYRGLVFATFSEHASSLYDYIGPHMRQGLDRIFHKPVEYLGCVKVKLEALQGERPRLLPRLAVACVFQHLQSGGARKRESRSRVAKMVCMRGSKFSKRTMPRAAPYTRTIKSRRSKRALALKTHRF